MFTPKKGEDPNTFFSSGSWQKQYIKEMGAHYVTEAATLWSTFPKDSGESVQKRGFKDLNAWPLYNDTCAESSKAPLLGACPQPQGQPQVESRLFWLQLPVICCFFPNLCFLITNLLLVGFLSPTAGSTSGWKKTFLSPSSATFQWLIVLETCVKSQRSQSWEWRKTTSPIFTFCVWLYSSKLKITPRNLIF